MKNAWFKKTGWIYTPVSWQGNVILIALLAFCIHVFLVIDHVSPSISDTFYGVFPFIAPAFLLYLWLASENK